jgi:anti-sigma regulatory factor (Ser/Thr protein kinase)
MSVRPWRDLRGGSSSDATSVPRPAEPEFRVELPTGLSSARQARAVVRQALAAWGLESLSGDLELLASELVANSIEHVAGRAIRLTLTRHREPEGQLGITCEVTDNSPSLPQPRQAGPDEERGRGLAIVAALATASGVRPEPTGKTTWFTLALCDGIERAAQHAEPEAEAEA